VKRENERGFLSPFESGRKEFSPFPFLFHCSYGTAADCWENPLIRLRGVNITYSKAQAQD
jgi:hypothetical protein